MVIENTTRATKNLLGKFCFANMFYKGRNILVILPLMTILVGLVVLKFYPSLDWLVEATTTLAIAFPIFIVAINMMIFNKNMRAYPKEGKTSKIDFSDEGIFAGGVERDKKIEYSFVTECVEFRNMFILYFKGTSPIVVEKKGFRDGEVKMFKEMMKRNIK
ncbi:MAG: YcxB family protein [Bacillota bacterium]